MHFDFQFDQPQKISAVTLGTPGGRLNDFTLSFSVTDDDLTYRVVKSFDSDGKGNLGWTAQVRGVGLSFDFPAQSTRHFRITFERASQFELTGISLFETDRVDLWQIKAGLVQYAEHGGSGGRTIQLSLKLYY